MGWFIRPPLPSPPKGPPEVLCGRIAVNRWSLAVERRELMANQRRLAGIPAGALLRSVRISAEQLSRSTPSLGKCTLQMRNLSHIRHTVVGDASDLLLPDGAGSGLCLVILGGGGSNWPPGILADPPTHPPTSENFSSGKK